MTSFCVQFEKRGRGLLREAFRGKGEWAVGWKRGGKRERIGPEKRRWTLEYLQYIKQTQETFPPHFQPTVHSPIPRKASHSNPCSFFSNCTQNGVTTVRHCWTSFRKKAIIYYYFFWQKWSKNLNTEYLRFWILDICAQYSGQFCLPFENIFSFVIFSLKTG